jgi:hypothetical protein
MSGAEKKEENRSFHSGRKRDSRNKVEKKMQEHS